MAKTRQAGRAPKQERSRQTLERILRATERLLQDQPFDDLSIRAIIKASQTSIGSFYNLFEDKQALLAGLYERYDAGLDVWIAEWRARQAASPTTLVEASSWVARYLIETFHERRHLLRALALFVRAHPGDVPELRSNLRASQHRFLAETLLEQRAEMRHEDPERAVASAVFAAASISRERILFSDSVHARATVLSEAQLHEDLVHLMVGLLSPDPRFDFSAV